MLTENREVLDMIAETLIEKEKISGIELINKINEIKPNLIKEGALAAVTEASGPKDKQGAYAFQFSGEVEPQYTENNVKEFIAGNPVMVFSKDYCPYCNKAKTLLSSANIDFYAVELDIIKNGNSLHEALKSYSSQKTVPAIYIGGQFIGGYDDLLTKK